MTKLRAMAAALVLLSVASYAAASGDCACGSECKCKSCGCEKK